MFIHMHVQNGEKLTCMMCKFPAKAEQGNTLPSCFSSHTVNKCLFSSIFSATFLVLLGFLFGDFPVYKEPQT